MSDDVELVDASIVELSGKLETIAQRTRDDTDRLLGNYTQQAPSLEDIYNSIQNRQKLSAMLVPLTAARISLRASITKVDIALAVANRIMEVTATRLMRHHSGDTFMRYKANLSSLDPDLVEQLHTQLLRQQQRAALEGKLESIDGLLTLIHGLLRTGCD